MFDIHLQTAFLLLVPFFVTVGGWPGNNQAAIRRMRRMREQMKLNMKTKSTQNWGKQRGRSAGDVCKTTTNGKYYRGTISTTKSGLSCQKWGEIGTRYGPKTSPKAGLTSNNCRNPNNKPNGPWCYTNTTDASWEYCPVPLCSGVHWMSPDKNDKRIWRQSRKRCREIGGNLTSINNDQESADINALIGDNAGGVWIGLKRRKRNFVWSDKSDSDYRDWTKGEPNHSGNCVQIYRRRWSPKQNWYDADCKANLRYICHFKVEENCHEFKRRLLTLKGDDYCGQSAYCQSRSTECYTTPVFTLSNQICLLSKHLCSLSS